MSRDSIQSSSATNKYVLIKFIIYLILSSIVCFFLCFFVYKEWKSHLGKINNTPVWDSDDSFVASYISSTKPNDVNWIMIKVEDKKIKKIFKIDNSIVSFQNNELSFKKDDKTIIVQVKRK